MTARLEADLYALTHRGTPGDAAFYARFCAGARSVLELGAGYGRLVSALARARRLVVGLDCDAQLLAAAKRSLRSLPLAKGRSVRLVQGDMRSFELGQRFERVVLPYNGLYCLLTKRDALACFRAVRAALDPGGTFAFDVWNAEAFQRQPAVRTRVSDPEPIVALRHAGCTWDVFEHSRIRRVAQRLDVVYEYVPRTGGAARQIPIAQRYYRPAELRALLERAGFAVQARYGDFSGARFTPRSPHLIIVAGAI
ncbi:MAG TPA: class I SAM-dependent methyltransferase [Polyangiaceae bacterium]|jgi:SAM-dependent methyltransferase|nr:class I SAM-dependent methyltransferase [Polyangiaceae bacterium]